MKKRWVLVCWGKKNALFTHVTYDRNADEADNADFHGFFVLNVLQFL